MRLDSGNKSLLIRADASTEIGTGHVMRMIALGQAWRDRGGDVTIASCECPETLKDRLADEGIEFAQISAASPGDNDDCKQTSRMAQTLGCKWVVIDGYEFHSDFHLYLREASLKVLAVDDYCQNASWAVDAILNQNLSATDSKYESSVGDCQFLLGTKYALLRKEFIGGKQSMATNKTHIQNLLVTLGGGDRDNASSKILNILNQIDKSDLKIRLLVGVTNPHLTNLTKLASESQHQIEILTNVRDMPSMFAWADGVISAAGSTCWEWLHFELPAAVVIIADNQDAIARKLACEKLAINLGWHEELSTEQTLREVRTFICNASQARSSTHGIIDGLGAKRVCALLDESLEITIATAKEGWLAPRLDPFVNRLRNSGHSVRVVHSAEEIRGGDVLLLLSMWGLIPPDKLSLHAHNLVVHESDLPIGRGWSPISWNVFNGVDEIDVCLLEAAEKADAGPIYLREKLHLRGHELVDEIRDKQAEVTFQLCCKFLHAYPEVAAESKTQTGESSYFRRRTPEDSELDPNVSISEQFNLLRIVDNEAYPAFFEFRGHQYVIRIDRKPAS